MKRPVFKVKINEVGFASGKWYHRMAADSELTVELGTCAKMWEDNQQIAQSWHVFTELETGNLIELTHCTIVEQVPDLINIQRGQLTNVVIE